MNTVAAATVAMLPRNILVEGMDDLRLIEKVLHARHLHGIAVLEYANAFTGLLDLQRKVSVHNLIRICGGRSHPGDPYLIITDSDDLGERKRDLLRRVLNDLEPRSLVIVKHEIESWYVSGYKPILDKNGEMRLVLKEVTSGGAKKMALDNKAMTEIRWGKEVDLNGRHIVRISPEQVTKEHFDKYVAGMFLGKKHTDAIGDVLYSFDEAAAIRNSPSFAAFVEKLQF
jgi:hypothetical protein